MTRAEINRNIRYNENLVSSYGKTVQSLNSQINELVSLKRRIQSCQSEFVQRENARKSKLTEDVARKTNLKCASSYINGMRGLLNGTDFRNSYNGLTTAIQKIDRQIESLRNEVNSNNNLLSYRKNRITYWKRRLKYATR